MFGISESLYNSRSRTWCSPRRPAPIVPLVRNTRCTREESPDTSGTALTTRVQYKFAERFLLQLDAYYAIHARDAKGHQDAENDDDSAALRMELRVNF